jgi:pimeloyl-ACP methyl ester carboxylesterase
MAVVVFGTASRPAARAEDLPDHETWLSGLHRAGRRARRGARVIPVTTPAGPYRVWVKRVGNSPGLALLMLHGGPGSTHEYLEACDSYLPAAGIEYYYYDQLAPGSAISLTSRRCGSWAGSSTR